MSKPSPTAKIATVSEYYASNELEIYRVKSLNLIIVIRILSVSDILRVYLHF